MSSVKDSQQSRPEGPAVRAATAENGAVERVGLLERENMHLREALTSRIVIEQAKGVLAERFGLDLDQAFELLRRAARSNRMRIHELAAGVVPGRKTPAQIEAVVSSRPRARVDADTPERDVA